MSGSGSETLAVIERGGAGRPTEATYETPTQETATYGTHLGATSISRKSITARCAADTRSARSPSPSTQASPDHILRRRRLGVAVAPCQAQERHRI